MAQETDPVATLEVVLRRIPNHSEYVNFELPHPIMRLAFRPATNDDDGISLFRTLFTTAIEVAGSGGNARGYYVVTTSVTDFLPM